MHRNTGFRIPATPAQGGRRLLVFAASDTYTSAPATIGDYGIPIRDLDGDPIAAAEGIFRDVS